MNQVQRRIAKLETLNPSAVPPIRLFFRNHGEPDPPGAAEAEAEGCRVIVVCWVAPEDRDDEHNP